MSLRLLAGETPTPLRVLAGRMPAPLIYLMAGGTPPLLRLMAGGPPAPPVRCAGWGGLTVIAFSDIICL